MKIEIDLNDLGFIYDPEGDPIGRQTITDAIVETAARLLLADGVQKKQLRDRVDTAVEARINERVAVMVDEAFAEPVQRTDLWGEPQGPKLSVRGLIRESIDTWLTVPKVRNSGGTYAGSGHYPNGGPAKSLRDLVEHTTASLLDRELSATIKAAKAQITNEVIEKGLRAAVAAISPKAV